MGIARIMVLVLILASHNGISQNDIVYPTTRVLTKLDTFYGVVIQDNYAWLENRNSEVKLWIDRQNDLSSEILKKVRKRSGARKGLDDLSYSRFRAPTKHGIYYVSGVYEDQYNSASYFASKNPIDRGRKIIDPKKISKDNKVDVTGISHSNDGEYFAYTYTDDGSDWRKIGIVTNKGKPLDDILIDIKFSQIIWRKNGFYYLKRERDKFESAVSNPQIFYHEIGTNQDEDRLIFKRNNNNIREFSLYVSDDERFFIISEKIEAKGYYNYYYVDFNKSESIRPLYLKSIKSINFLGNYGDKLLCLSKNSDEETIIFYIDVNNPREWQLILQCPEKFILLNAFGLQKKILIEYSTNGRQLLIFYDLEGNIVEKKLMDWGMTISGLNVSKFDYKISYFLTTYTVPPILYEMNAFTYETNVIYSAEVPYDYTRYIIYPLHFNADDGEEVTIMVMHKKGLKMNSANPCLLNGYGGFGSIHSPSYNKVAIHFVQQGGVYAYAMIRGGGEKGVDWHTAGKNMNKQRSYSDFIQAAEHLISKGYTNSQKLAISGASNGGLLVAAVMIQRPDLFKVVVPVVGVFDMIQAENYTVGVYHKDEFGSVNNKEEFENLLSYSPYHNIDSTVNYPITLVMTSENDDRVPPFHSYKFVAALQNNPAQKNPIYLRVEKNAGHYGGSTYKAGMTESADKLGFILSYLK